MSAPVISFDVVTFHARGAWPYRDGEMTHSADGVATLASGEIISFTTSRYHVPSEPRGERTSYSIALYSASRRELTAAKWDALKADIRKAFTGHIRAMAEGPRPAAIHPGTKTEADAMREIAHACERGDCDASEIAPFADSYVEMIRTRLAGDMAAPSDAAAEIAAHSVEMEAEAASRAHVLVANTTRACYWQTESGAFIASGPDVAAADVRDNGGGYTSLGALMRLKGEADATIARVLADMPARPAALAIVTGRSVDGAEYLTPCGMSGDRRAALVMPWADAVEIAKREDARAAATRSPDRGVYGIKAAPFTGPALYSLADYERDEQEAADLDALYGEQGA